MLLISAYLEYERKSEHLEKAHAITENVLIEARIKQLILKLPTGCSLPDQ